MLVKGSIEWLKNGDQTSGTYSRGKQLLCFGAMEMLWNGFRGTVTKPPGECQILRAALTPDNKNNGELWTISELRVCRENPNKATLG